MSSTETDDTVDGASPEAQLVDLLLRFRRNIELDLRVSAPARIITYDPVTQTATVRLELMPVPIIEGEEVPTPAPPLHGVPVVWHGGTAGYVSTPLAPGDPGKVTFTDRCLSTWLQTGNPAGPVDPINRRTHNLADAVFEPGLRPLAEARQPTDQTATVVEGPLIKLGYGATQPVALAPLVQAQLEALKAAIQSAPVSPLDGGTTFKAALVAALTAWPASTAATKTQAA